MRISNCPYCGKKPVITELCTIKKFKNGIRRRMCGCPNYCLAINAPFKKSTSIWDSKSDFIFLGDGDDNQIYKVWNLAIASSNWVQKLPDPSKIDIAY